MAQHRPRVLRPVALRSIVAGCAVLAGFGGEPRTAAAQGVVPAGHRSDMHGPSFAGPPFGGAAYAGPQYGSPETIFNGPCPDDAYVTRKMIPDPQSQYGPRPHLFNGALTAGGVRARLEYRSYWFSDPGQVPIGATQLPTDISPFFNITTLNETVNDIAEPFDTGGFGFEGVNSIGANLAFQTQYGGLEIDGFATEQASASFTTRSRIRALPIDALTGLTAAEVVRPAIPLRAGGSLSTSLAIPLDELTVSQSVELFGAGATWVLPPLTPNVPLTSSIVVGGRYFQYTEHFRINGMFTQVNQELDLLTGDIITETFEANPRITSRAINHVFGPTIGMRFDAPGRWLSLGVEPRFGFGISRRVERVQSSDLLTPDPGLDDDLIVEDPMTTRTRTNEEADLAPFFELNVYGRAHVRENFSLFVGYNLLALSRMSTAARQIDYDSGGGEALINLDQDTRSIVVHGLMVGGEWVWGR